MAFNLEERIEKLKTAIEPVLPEDHMAEAGRKILRTEFVKMLENDPGSRTGEDIEHVHDMRVAIRKMRSLFRLLEPYYKRRAVSAYKTELRHVAWTLGAVRDLDVLIEDLQTYRANLKGAKKTELQTTIDELDRHRHVARAELVEVLDSRLYRRLIKDFSKFLLTTGDGAKPQPKDDVMPVQVRHLLPIMLYHRLAAVRAFDAVLAEADAVTLHSLRIEFKQLRYTLTLFQEVLGPQAAEYVDAIKKLQDCLGHLNDAVIARAYLNDLLGETLSPVVNEYIASLEIKEAALKEQLAELWTQFNSRKTQQKLSSAVLALR